MSKGAQLLTKAERSLAAAERLLADGDPDFAASRAYYGFFYVAEALLHSEGLEFLRHGQVLAQYGRHFAKTGRLDPRFHKLFSRAFSARQIADYAAVVEFETEEVAELIREGRSFLAAARSHLESQADPSPSPDGVHPASHDE